MLSNFEIIDICTFYDIPLNSTPMLKDALIDIVPETGSYIINLDS
jgi:hypothetical protein